MPQGPAFLHEFWENDTNAWEHLSPNFDEHDFVISPKEGYRPTFVDYRAIDYLCMEWDWGYSVPVAASSDEAKR